MEHKRRILTLLLAAAFLLMALPAAAASAASSEAATGNTFTATVNLPEALEGRSDVTVLSGALVQLIACYDGKYEAPAGTQFCWQYSTSGEADSYNYLAPAPDSSDHISTNAVNVTSVAGATWYRVILEDSDHTPVTDFVPNQSTPVVVRRVDFLFTAPASDPEPLALLPGGSAELGPVKAETARQTEVRYQWQQADGDDWKDIAGAAGTTFATGALPAGSYRYRCLASAPLTAGEEPRTITSPVYALEVTPLALAGYTLTVDGEEVALTDGKATLTAGTTASLTVRLTDASVPVAYQWQYAGSGGWYDLGTDSGTWGYATPTLHVPVSEQTDGNRYRCTVTAADAVLGTEPDDPVVTLSSSDPAAAFAEVRPSPFIFVPGDSGQQTEIAAPAGKPVLLRAENRSTPEIPADLLGWQWESAPAADGPFSAISGATDPSLVIRTQENTPLFCRCRASNTAAAETLETMSNTIAVRPLRPDGTVYFTEPLEAPAPVRVQPGDDCTFTALAQCDDATPVRYCWQYARVAAAETAIEAVPDTAWTNLPDGEGSVCTATNLQAGFYFFRCTAENSEDPEKQAVSPAAKICVIPPSQKPVVSPQETVEGADGAVYGNVIAVGAPVGGSATFQVEASVPSGDRLDYTWYMMPSGPAAAPELLEGNSAALTLADVPARYDACSFYCIVSNRSHRTEQTRSAAWYLSVWPAGRVPRILSQPANAFASFDPTDPPAELIISVTASGSTDAVLEQQAADGSWQTCDAVRFKNVAEDGTGGGEAASQTYHGTIPLDAASYALNGTYRVRVNNGTAVPPGLPPCALSNTFMIQVDVAGQPVITEDPSPVSAEAGSAARFTVGAAVTPPQTPLVFCWQISEDGGRTYRNCLAADGTPNGDVFVTAPLTADLAEAEPKRMYRCLVANAATGQQAVSAAGELTVLPGEPAPPVTGDAEITVEAGSSLRAEDGLLTGLNATRSGTPVSAVLPQLAASPGYHLELRTLAGATVPEESPVGTGMLVSLVRDTDPGEIPATLTVVVRGDVTGTGLLSIAQVTAMARSLNGQNPLDGAYLRAGDFNGNGTIDISDLVSEAKLLTQAEPS